MASVSRYKAILKEVAADLKVELDSELCKHVASLRLLRENAVAKACRGERVPVADIVALDAALKAYLPQSEGLQIQVRYVEGVTGTYKCQHCGERNYLEPNTYTPAERPKPEIKPEVSPAGPVADAAPKVTTDEPASPPKVMHREGVSGSDFHNARLSNGQIAPLKRYQPSH